MAVIRYRLYEIDRLVRRTVSLCGPGRIAGIRLSRWRHRLGHHASVATDPLAVAGATLAAAALFNPVRRRVQGWVDRRFDRARYDAQQVVEQFSSRLRAETDLDGLRSDLTGVVEEHSRGPPRCRSGSGRPRRETVGLPPNASRWLREDAT